MASPFLKDPTVWPLGFGRRLECKKLVIEQALHHEVARGEKKEKQGNAVKLNHYGSLGGLSALFLS